MVDIRVTRSIAEVLGSTDPDVRVTRTIAEVLGNTSSNIRVTRTVAEVLGTPADPNLRVHRSVLLVLVNGVPSIDVTASNTITFAQTNDIAGIFAKNVDDPITFAQSNVVNIKRSMSANNTLTFSQTSSSGVYSRSAYSILTFSQSTVGLIPSDVELSASHSITFSQTSNPGLFTRTAYNTIDFAQQALESQELASGTVLTASNAIVFSQSNNRAHVLVTATVLTASDTVTFTDRAIFPKEMAASNAITFTQTNLRNVGKSVTQVFELTQTVILNHVRSLTTSDAISFKQSFVFEHFRNGVLIVPGSVRACDITKEYSPASGGNTSLVRPVVPALERHTDVELYFPSTDQCSSTYNIILRTPNFGDRDRNQYNRINRESRGGSLRIFRDPKWPSQRSLVMDFSAIKDTEVDGILSFLENTLGQLIGFRDWQGRQWVGIVTNPNTAIVRNGTDRNDLSIEMEVDDPMLDYQVCQTLSFTQSADVELIPA